MVDICFIILNYNLYEETMTCVQSIKTHIDTDSFSIIIVDNASPNGTGERLKELYISDETVDVILLPENIGFARGNNVGIKKAREMGAKYICCINDDAEILSYNFYAVINEKYEEYHPALIGPKVINREGKEDQFYHPFHSIEEYEQILNRVEKETFRQYKNRHGISVKHRLRKVVDRNKLARRVFRRLKIIIKGVDPYKTLFATFDEDTRDLVMLGCCLVFTPIFFDYLEGFDSSTFLYAEEEFLQAHLLVHGLHSMYIPEIEVFHKEGLSTATVGSKNAIKRWQFKRSESVESLRLLVAFLKEHEKEIYRHGNGA